MEFAYYLHICAGQGREVDDLEWVCLNIKTTAICDCPVLNLLGSNIIPTLKTHMTIGGTKDHDTHAFIDIASYSDGPGAC